MASTSNDHHADGNPHNPTSASASASSIEIDRRTSRSFLSSALITSLRPLKGHLIKSGKPYPPGSPKLKPPPFVYEQCNVHERTVRDIHIYDINVRSKSTQQYVAFQDSVQHGNRIEPPTLAGNRLRPTKSPSSKTSKRESTITPLPPDLQAQTPAQTNGAPPRPATSSSHTQTQPQANAASSQSDPSEPPTAPLTRPPTDTPALTLTRTKTRDFAHTPTPTRPRPRQIYYFAGGSWRQPPTKDHWKFLVSLVTRLTSGGPSGSSGPSGPSGPPGGGGGGVPTTISVISYPLAPHTPAAISLPMLERMYAELFRPVVLANPTPNPTPHPNTTNADSNAHEDGEVEDRHYEIVPGTSVQPEFWLAGDSSGGNIALSLVCEILRKDPKTRNVPDALMLISPTVRMALDHPKLAGLESKDPILSRKHCESSHAAWCGVGDSKLGEGDPRVSPYYAELGLLRERGVSVNGANAGYDILGPDCEDFVQRLGREGVRGKWLCWERMMHCFPLTAGYGVTEGREGVEWIVKTIQAEREKS